jgi:hypothetical protein
MDTSKRFRGKVIKPFATLTFALALSACMGGESSVSQVGSANSGGAGNSSAASSPGAPAPVGSNQANVFFSGHSLINLNTPTLFAQLAQSRSLAVSYQLQMGLGSSILYRLQCPWNGQQADGHPIQYRVQNELVRSNVYDTLVLAENHDLLSSIQYSRTTSTAKVMYDLFTTGNPDGQAYLYENWLYRDSPNLDALLARIDRERPAWDCVASMVNTTRVGAQKPMKIMPGSTALAALIRDIRLGNVPSITAGESLFHDNVHLNSIGNYFISLLYYAVIYGRSPVGLPHSGLTVLQETPPVLSEATATRLQEIAWAQAQLLAADTASFRKSPALCQTEMQALCIQTYGATWPCNGSNPERLPAMISVLSAPVPHEPGAWCKTGPDPY